MLSGALIAGTVGVVSLLGASPALAVPGSPGVPGDPTVVYHEDFENASGQNLSIVDYDSVTGIGYSASDFWSNRAECNGFVTSKSTPTNSTDCTVADFGSESRRLSFQNTVRQMVSAISALNGGDPQTNSGLAELANSRAPSGEVVFQTDSLIPLASPNRFVTFSVNAAATTCGRSQANLEFFAVNEDAVETPLTTTPLNPCTQGQVIGSTTDISTGPIYGGTLFSQRSILLDGSSLGILLRNATDSTDGNGNDFAIDDVRVVDVTPQLDKSFSPASVPVGGVSTLTFTVTATTAAPAVAGWQFTDTLADGLVVADEPNIGGTCDATVSTSAGASAIGITNGSLDAGEESCTITVDVTSDTPRGADPSPVTYENCAENISNQIGLDSPACAKVEFYSEPELQITKTSDATAETRVGDTVTYTVTATNTGTADYTEAAPAVVFDDLSGVLDDAAYNGDAAADQPGSVSYSTPLLSWTGALAVGKSVTLNYTVKVIAGGDGSARNIAWAPDDPTKHVTPKCDGAAGATTDPTTDEPCAATTFELPRLAITKVADRTELPAVGNSIGYTVTITNVGPGDYTADHPATAVDDLTRVLDDATFDGAANASAGTTAYAAPKLSWQGVLASGESSTITYSVIYTGAGDARLVNTACVPDSEAAEADACATVGVPGAHLAQWKTVESSDSPAVAGSVLTYTLHFANDGAAAAKVDSVDLLDHVLDDATVTAEPVASGGLTAVRSGNTIAITGSVGVNAEATVTYQVKVKADGSRGDDIAANYLMSNDPADPPTVPESPTCTPADAAMPNCTSTPIAAVTYAKSVAASDTLIGTGTVLTYTITIKSTGAATAPISRDDVLADVLDDATLTSVPASDTSSVAVGAVTDGRFHIGGELAGGRTATVSYTATVNDASHRGNNTADNFLVGENQSPPSTCADEATDCTVTPLSAVAVVKSADPESGTAVAAGDEVTYTLTFTNAGEAIGSVDYTDVLSGVLDDAKITGKPTSSDSSLEVALDGSKLRVTGTITPAAAITVVYTVTVKPDAAQGDSVLRNVVVVTGDDPVCDAQSTNCTEHPTTHLPVDPPPGPGNLAFTGATPTPLLLMALLLVPLGAGLIAFGRLRRSREQQGENPAR